MVDATQSKFGGDDLDWSRLGHCTSAYMRSVHICGFMSALLSLRLMAACFTLFRCLYQEWTD